ncbi:MAG: hypothetical protein HOP33_03870 [Verrucomicrobia bacterium]|nr:hypothetical protein [Verrucomicrobiota bacterium]
MQNTIIFADTVIPPEAMIFYYAVYALVAALLIAVFIAGLILTRGARRVVGLWLAFGSTFLLVLLAIFVTIVRR